MNWKHPAFRTDLGRFSLRSPSLPSASFSNPPLSSVPDSVRWKKSLRMPISISLLFGKKKIISRLSSSPSILFESFVYYVSLPQNISCSWKVIIISAGWFFYRLKIRMKTRGCFLEERKAAIFCTIWGNLGVLWASPSFVVWRLIVFHDHSRCEQSTWSFKICFVFQFEKLLSRLHWKRDRKLIFTEILLMSCSRKRLKKILIRMKWCALIRLDVEPGKKDNLWKLNNFMKRIIMSSHFGLDATVLFFLSGTMLTQAKDES